VHDPEDVARIFREHGLKVTPQRRLIFRIMAGASGHVTADVVYTRAREEMETISVKTVYETLHSLADLGQIRAVDLGMGSMVFDRLVEPHDHLLCTSCGKTEDIHFEVVPPRDDDCHGFAIADTRVVARGLCPECAARAR
jgi:Fe2+ or Zn2+ uptake regulation protein